jgi:hypothetical protein
VLNSEESDKNNTNNKNAAAQEPRKLPGPTPLCTVAEQRCMYPPFRPLGHDLGVARRV